MKSTAIAIAAAIFTQASVANEDWCKRPNHPSFSPAERVWIERAKHHLEKLDKQPLDACYDVKRASDKDEFFVHVTYVAGYRDGAPLVTLGGHAFVVFDKRGKLLRSDRGE